MKNLIFKVSKVYGKRIILTLFSVLLLSFSIQTFAIDSPYTAGETLDPACAPEEVNCTVTILPVLTVGSVPFSNGTALTEDNANLFWDDTNNRLGIGTATPTATFQVAGTGAVTPTAGSVKISNGSIFIPNAGLDPSVTRVGTIFLGNVANTTFQPVLYRGLANEVQIHGGNGRGMIVMDTSSNIAIGKFDGDTIPTSIPGGSNGIYFHNNTAGESTKFFIRAGDTQGVDPLFTFLSNANVNLSLFDENGQYATASRDLGDGLAGPVITLGRNTNATNSGAGSINFLDKDGDAGYVWQDAAGNLRIHTAAPTTANDTAGVVVGAQTSTRDTKDEIEEYTDYQGALSLVLDAPLNTFRYRNEILGYGEDSPLAKTRIGYIADEVDPMFMVGNTIDQVSVNGLLIASIKALDLKIEGMGGDSAVTTSASPSEQDDLCAKKSDGSEICLTGDQLEALLSNIEEAPEEKPADEETDQ